MDLQEITTAGACALDKIFADLPGDESARTEGRNSAIGVLSRALDLVAGHNPGIDHEAEAQRSYYPGEERDEHGRWTTGGASHGKTGLANVRDAGSPSQAAHAAKVQSGDLVKVALDAQNGKSKEFGDVKYTGERVWVHVTKNENGLITGKVDKADIPEVHGVKTGAMLTFKHSSVRDIAFLKRSDDSDTCVRSIGKPSSVNLDDRTFWATVLTDSPVTRSDPRGPFAEVLDPNAVEPASLVGLPVLDWHSQGSVNKVLGKIIDARRSDSGDIEAKFQISSAEPAILTKIAEGTIAGTSVGYKVHDWAESTNNGIRTRTAKRLTVREISLTPCPADPACTIRSSKEMDMDNSAVPNRAEINSQIRAIAASAGLGAAWADHRIDGGVSDLTAVRAQAFEALSQRGSRPLASVQVLADHNDPTLIRSAMSEALAARLDPAMTLEGRARDYAGWSLLDLGAELARARGERVDSRNRNGAADLLTRSGSHTTSDFPLLLENAVNKAVLPKYQAATPTYKSWAAQKSFNDFRPHKSLRLGDFPSLTEVTSEGGPITYGTISENRESITPKEFNSGISVSRRALVNDDLGALQDFTGLIGQRVASDENAWMYAMLAANPALSDSYAVFESAHHGNLTGSGTAIAVASLGIGIKALRNQTSLNGVKLNLVPSVLLVGPAIETVARQYLTAISPNTSSSVNPWSDMFKLVVDANITGNEWYLFADPAVAPVFQYGYVQGQGPVVRSEIDFDTRGLRVSVGLDFGYGAVDFRGAYKNVGA